MKKVLSLILTLVLVCGLIPAAHAAEDEAVQAAQTLYELGLFKGTGTNRDGTPVFDLDKIPTRNQAVIMLVRLLGKEEEALAGTWELPFTDVAKGSTAYPYIGYAYANGLANGTSTTTYGGGNPIRANQYITFVLRALGYTSGEDFQVSTAWEFSDKIGLTGGEYSAATKTFTRGDVAKISCDSLEVLLADGTRPLSEKLIKEGVFSERQYISAIDRKNAVSWNGGTEAFPGRGTAADPYRIETAQQLAQMALWVNKGNPFENAYFRLMADIDLQNLEWTPIGNFGSMFSGKFDGNGHTISNLRITKLNQVYVADWNHWHDTYSSVGLFGTVGARGEVKNLSVSGEILISVENAPDKESVAVGGVAGCLYGAVYDCYNECKVTVISDSKDAYMNAGGIVGVYGQNSILDGCGNTGEICAEGTHVIRVGGIAGDSDGEGILANCWNRGSVTAKGGRGQTTGAGGMTCHTYDTIIANCYNLGNITSDGYAGGILAYQIGSDTPDEQPELYNCYSAGEVRGQGESVGAICGRAYKGIVQNVFWKNDRMRAVGSTEGKTTVSVAETMTDSQQLLDRLNAWVAENQEFTWSAWEWNEGEMHPVLCK